MRSRTSVSVGLAVLGGVFLIAALVCAMVVKGEDHAVLWVLIGIALFFGVVSWVVR